jgi:hypothetical protein
MGIVSVASSYSFGPNLLTRNQVWSSVSQKSLKRNLSSQGLSLHLGKQLLLSEKIAPTITDTESPWRGAASGA